MFPVFYWCIAIIRQVIQLPSVTSYLLWIKGNQSCIFILNISPVLYCDQLLFGFKHLNTFKSKKQARSISIESLCEAGNKSTRIKVDGRTPNKTLFPYSL